jgi:hypothetical protein
MGGLGHETVRQRSAFEVDLTKVFPGPDQVLAVNNDGALSTASERSAVFPPSLSHVSLPGLP